MSFSFQCEKFREIVCSFALYFAKLCAGRESRIQFRTEQRKRAFSFYNIVIVLSFFYSAFLHCFALCVYNV